MSSNMDWHVEMGKLKAGDNPDRQCYVGEKVTGQWWIINVDDNAEKKGGGGHVAKIMNRV